MIEPPDTTHDQEARLLAELLRSSRLALLYGDAGTDKTALLKRGLMPLLRRRATDRSPVGAAHPEVAPNPERRGRRGLRRRREIVVYFDDWIEQPLDALHIRILLTASKTPSEHAMPRVRLAERLNVLSDRLDANFILLLDRFEILLAAPQQREDVAKFTDELVEAINLPRLPANFLISLNEEARPYLATLRNRIPGFDDYSLRLTRPAPPPASMPPPRAEPPDAEVIESVPPTLTEASIVRARNNNVKGRFPPASPPPTERPPRPHGPPPRKPIKTADVYAFIQTTLATTASDVSSEPFRNSEFAEDTDSAPLASDNAAPRKPKATVSMKSPAATPPRAQSVPAPELPIPVVEDEVTPIETPSATSAAAVSAGTPSVPAADASAGSPDETPRGSLGAAVEWVERRLRAKRKPKPESEQP